MQRNIPDSKNLFFLVLRILFSGCQILNSRFRIPDSIFQIPARFQIRDSRFQILDSRFRIPESGNFPYLRVALIIVRSEKVQIKNDQAGSEVSTK